MWRSAPYRTATSKLSDLRHPIVTKTPWEFEHLAVDFLHPIEVSVSIKKNDWTEDGRRRKAIFNDTKHQPMEFYHKNIAPLITPTKSVAFFADGSMPLWTLRSWRRAKKMYKLTHSPASDLMVGAEETIRSAFQEKLQGKDKVVSEIVVSGARSNGNVDTKITGWAADLAARGMSRNERIAVVGNTAQYATLMAMVPFHNVSFFALAHQHSYQFHFYDMLEYYGLLSYIESPHFARIRADMVFLMLMAYGLKWADMQPLAFFSLQGFMDAYHSNFLEKGRFLFDEKLRLNVRHAQSVVSSAKASKSNPPRDGQGLPASKEYVNVLLQTHYALCTGRMLNPHYVPEHYNCAEPPQALSVHSVASALDGIQSEFFTPEVVSTPPVSPLTYSMAAIGSEFASQYTSLPAWVKAYKDPLAAHQKMMAIIECTSILKAITIADEFTTLIGEAIPDKVKESKPSYVLKRGFSSAKNTCTISPFDVGRLAQSQPANRLKDYSKAPVVWDPLLRQQTKSIVVYNHSTSTWTKRPVDAEGSCRTHNAPQTFRVISWNILFDKYNNERTYMGKPAIDRCSKQRYIAISQVLQDSNADVICLQEVMQDFYEFIVDQPWVRNYTVSCDKTHADINPWGSLMLCHCRHTVTGSVSHNLPGYNGHISLMPEMALKIRNEWTPLKVSSCHLSSCHTGGPDQVRKTQIVNLLRVCADDESAIRVGDFNEEWSFPAALSYQDAWTASGKAERDGWTIDNSRNGLADRLIEQQFNGRYDRIFYKSRHLVLSSCELVGTQPVHAIVGGEATYPEWLHCSDHFGVQATFDLQ